MLDWLASAGPWLDRRPLLSRAVIGLLLVPAMVQLATMVWLSAGRLGFPLQLEWLEGSQVYHAARMLEGDPIYRQAVSGFLPHPYPPLHAAMMAAVGTLWDLSYTSARALSVACFAVAASVLTWRTMLHWPRRARAVVALVSFGYLATTYPMVSGWYDLARIDSAALAFAVLAAAALDRQGGPVRGTALVLSGFLATLSLYTKQTNLFLVVWLCSLVLVRERQRAWLMLTTLGVTSVGVFAWLEWQTGGAFAGWLFGTANHSLRPAQLGTYAWRLLVHTPFLLFVPLAAMRTAGQGHLTRSSRLWLGMLVAAIPASLLPYVKAGGAENNLIPIYFLAGPVTLMVAGDALESSTGGREGEPAGRWKPGPLIWIVLVVQALVASLHGYDPRDGRPSTEERDQATTLNTVIAGLEGDLVCPLDPFLPVANGGQAEQAGWLSHLDATRAGRPGVTAKSYASWLMEERPRWVLLAGVPEEAPILRGIERHYALVRDLPAPRGPRWLRHPVPHKLYERCDRDGQRTHGHGPCNGGSGPAAE